MISCPTIASISPRQAAIRPRMIDSPAKATTRLKAMTMREKYSAGPNIRAVSASGGPKTMSPITLTVPPMKEPMAAIPRATPAFPCRASGLPSNIVTTDADSPGTRIRTEVIVPPYCVP